MTHAILAIAAASLLCAQTPRPKIIAGIVTKESKQSITVQKGEEDFEIGRDEDTKVTIDGKPGTFEAIKESDKATVLFDTEREVALKITITSQAGIQAKAMAAKEEEKIRKDAMERIEKDKEAARLKNEAMAAEIAKLQAKNKEEQAAIDGERRRKQEQEAAAARVSYDKFKKETFHSTPPITVASDKREKLEVFMFVTSTIPDDANKESDFSLIFVSKCGKEYKFRTSRDLYVIIDDREEPWEFDDCLYKMDSDVDIDRARLTISETILFPITKGEFFSLCSAKSVELKLGIYETKLSDVAIMALAAVYDAQAETSVQRFRAKSKP